MWNENQEANQILVPSQYEPEASPTQPTSTTTAAAESNGDAEEGKARSEQVWGGKPWKRSVVELGGEVLCVSQFTLFARTVKGTKPDFHRAMGGDDARVIYEALLKKLGDSYSHDKIKDGAFGEMMDVSLTNDGKFDSPSLHFVLPDHADLFLIPYYVFRLASTAHNRTCDHL